MVDNRTMNAVLSVLGESYVEVPEGTLYAGLLDRMSLDEFQSMLGFFAETGLVNRMAGPCVRPTAKLLGIVAGFRRRA